MKGLGALADAWQEPRSDVLLVGRRASFVDELTVAIDGKRGRTACYLPDRGIGGERMIVIELVFQCNSLLIKTLYSF